MKIVELELKDLTIPQGLLPRVLTGTVEEKVEEYAEMIEEGVEFDPIQVWEKEDGQYWVIDGVHRISAYKKAGKERIKAKLVKCKDELDYRIKAIQANLKHGLALSKGEKPILAQTLYRQGMKEEEIRKVFGVSDETVRKWLAPVKQEEKQAKIRKAIELREKGWKVKDIAKELGVDERTVYRYLEEPDKMVNDTKLTLLTPSNDPTPEGIRLFDEYLREIDRLPPAWNSENFKRWLKEQEKEVEGSVEDFVKAFTSVMKSAFKTFARMGEKDYEAVKVYLSKKEPLSKLSSISRKKLLDWGERFYRKMLEEAPSSPQPPSFTDSAGSPPAPSEEDRPFDPERDKPRTEDPFMDREYWLKRAEWAWDQMQAEGEQTTEAKEEKKKRAIDYTSVNPPGRPKKEKFFDKEKEIEDLKHTMRDALWTIIDKFGWEEAAKVLDEVAEEFREYAPEGIYER